MTSEVFNTDCLEYMRTLPDKAFQLAIADPPYGINAPNINMGGIKDHPRIAQRLKMEHKDKGRLNSGAGKLKDRVLNTSMFGWDNAVPAQEFFDELRRVCENVIIWGATTSICHRQDVLSHGTNVSRGRTSRKLNWHGHRLTALRSYIGSTIVQTTKFILRRNLSIYTHGVWTPSPSQATASLTP